VGEGYRQGDKNIPFLRSVLCMWAAGGGKGAEGTEGQSSESGAVPGQGHPESLPPVMAQHGSILAASEQRF